LVALASGLDPLSDQLAATLAGEVDDAGDERLADVVVVDLANEPDVELNEVWPELEDVTEAGKAGAASSTETRTLDPRLLTAVRKAP
jgi:hypothetical protein